MDDSVEKLGKEDKRLETMVKVYRLFEDEGYTPQEAFPMLLSAVSHFVAMSLIEGKRQDELNEILDSIRDSLKRTTTAYIKAIEEDEV
jgi:hypothetical protein